MHETRRLASGEKTKAKAVLDDSKSENVAITFIVNTIFDTGSPFVTIVDEPSES